MKITLRWHKDGWMADYHHDEAIRRLFGATILPTAFTAQASKDTVLQALRQLNPEADIRIGESL